MPAVIVLYVCRVIIAGPGLAATGWENLDWQRDIDDRMLCKRIELPMFNPGDERAAFTPERCIRASVQTATQWDQDHRAGAYRVWRTGCPAPILDLRTGEVIAWQLPSCPHPEMAVCLDDNTL